MTWPLLKERLRPWVPALLALAGSSPADVDKFLAFVESMTHRKRSSTLAEVANAAVFLASDNASGMTGTVANLTGGMIVD